MIYSGYIVEWCVSCPLDGHGGCDIDAADYEEAVFGNIDKARLKAKEVLPLDFFGAVMIRSFELDEDGNRDVDYENAEEISE